MINWGEGVAGFWLWHDKIQRIPPPVGLYIISPRWQLIRSLPSLFSLLTTTGSLPIFPVENVTPSKYFSVFGLDTCCKQNQYDALFVIFRYHLGMDRQGVKEVLGVKKRRKSEGIAPQDWN